MENLLFFVPLIVGVVWLFYLVLTKDLASQPLGRVMSYFVGFLLIVFLVGVIIDFSPNWVNARLQNSLTSTESREIVDTVEQVIDDSFSVNQDQQVLVPQPTEQPIINPDTGTVIQQPGLNAIQVDGGVQHTVMAGETLLSISRMYGVSLDSIRTANNLFNTDIIYVGQVLVIPGATSSAAPAATVVPTATPTMNLSTEEENSAGE